MTLWMLGATFSLIGVPFVWIAMRVFARDNAAETWPRAPGVVTSSRLESWTQRYREDGHDYERTMYKPVIRYTYVVDGKTLESTRVAKSVDDVATGQDAAKHYVDAYPVDKRISVLYDPKDPTSSWLEVHRSIGAIILLAFGCLWMGIGALLLGLWLFT